MVANNNYQINVPVLISGCAYEWDAVEPMLAHGSETQALPTERNVPNPPPKLYPHEVYDARQICRWTQIENLRNRVQATTMRQESRVRPEIVKIL